MNTRVKEAINASKKAFVIITKYLKEEFEIE